MSMSIKIKDAEGKDYTLSYDLRSVKQMADNGFNINTASDNYVVGIPQLFEGAFLRYHRTISRSKINEIWAQITDKPGFISALVEMYNEPVEALFGEPEDDAKKATWEVVK